MKSLAIIVVAAMAVGAMRLSQAVDSPDYRDALPFLDHPLPPLMSSSRPTNFFSGGPYSRHESPSYPAEHHHHSFDLDDDSTTVYGEHPPATSSYRGGSRIFFDSSYFPPRKPQTFYLDSFSANPLGSAREYQGPPPPMLLSEDLRMKQTLSSATRDERPRTVIDLSSGKAHDELRNHHRHHQQQSTTTAAEGRRPLSFGGHSSYLRFGDHSLGFASVQAVTGSDINPLAVTTGSQSSSLSSGTTRPGSTMHFPSTMTTTAGFQRQQSSNTPPHPPPPPPPEAQTSAPPTFSPKITGSAVSTSHSSANTARLNDLASTTPATTRLTSVSPKSGLDPVQNQLNQMSSVSMMMLQDSPKTSYEFRTITQGLPSAAHGQLPIEVAPKQQFHIPDVKHNFLIYDTKSGFPYYQPGLQITSQSNGNSNNDNENSNLAPMRFSIPTAPITSALTSQNLAPIKIAIQGVDFLRAPVTFTAVPANSNTQTTGQSEIDTTQLNKLNGETYSVSNAPSYYIVQNSERSKPVAQVGSGVSLGSFYVLPSNDQTKQALQLQTNFPPSALQLQLGGFNGIEYFMQSNNADQAKSASLNTAKVGPNLQERSPDQSYTKVDYQQNRW